MEHKPILGELMYFTDSIHTAYGVVNYAILKIWDGSAWVRYEERGHLTQEAVAVRNRVLRGEERN